MKLAMIDQVILLGIHECKPRPDGATPTIKSLREACGVMGIEWQMGILWTLIDEGLILDPDTLHDLDGNMVKSDGLFLTRLKAKGRIVAGMLLAARPSGGVRHGSFPG